MKYALVFIFIGLTAAVQAQDLHVHDPVMIKASDTYYLFCTGLGISVLSSADMKNWKKEKPVFDSPPEWAVKTVPGFKDHIWAPDISYRDGLYYLYYSVSVFGKNTSCIGLATNKALDPNSKDFQWIDHGKIIQSVPGRDLWNAIDPNLVYDNNKEPWLVFGSFWSGIKLVKMSNDLKRIAEPEVWYTVSKRARDYKVKDEEPGDGAVEAPFNFKKNDHYYLFVSFDFCCRGKKSTYKIVVGRSKDIYGPYIDQQGVAMNEGGGSLVLQGDTRWAGIGHNSVYSFDGKDYLVCHAYDSNDQGKPKLKIETLEWKDGWPVVKPHP